MAYSSRSRATVWVSVLKQCGVCSSESFDDLLAQPFPPLACPQNNPDMGRLLLMAAVAAEPGGVTMSKAQECYPRAHLASRLGGQSSLAQVTHMRSLNRHPTSHTNRQRHLLILYGQTSIQIQTSSQRHPRRRDFPLMEVSVDCP